MRCCAIEPHPRNWFRGVDSNHDSRFQRPASYRWTTSDQTGGPGRTRTFTCKQSFRSCPPLCPLSYRNKLEHGVGLEPTKNDFADRRLDRFGIPCIKA